MLDLDLLKAFLSVAETESFTRAAERLHRTQSTVSQQVKRLEETVGSELFDRTTRRIELTESGERLLANARRILTLVAETENALMAPSSELIRLGVPEDFAASRLTTILAEFSLARPTLRLEVTSDLSAALRRSFEAGDLDVAVFKARVGSVQGAPTWPERLCWVDSRKKPAIGRDPAPLVVFPPNGLYREEMIQALDQARRRWRIGYSSASLASIQSAVAAGLGVSLIPARAVLRTHQILGAKARLPDVKTVEISLHVKAGASPLAKALGERLRALLDAWR